MTQSLKTSSSDPLLSNPPSNVDMTTLEEPSVTQVYDILSTMVPKNPYCGTTRQRKNFVKISSRFSWKTINGCFILGIIADLAL